MPVRVWCDPSERARSVGGIEANQFLRLEPASALQRLWLLPPLSEKLIHQRIGVLADPSDIRFGSKSALTPPDPDFRTAPDNGHCPRATDTAIVHRTIGLVVHRQFRVESIGHDRLCSSQRTLG